MGINRRYARNLNLLILAAIFMISGNAFCQESEKEFLDKGTECAAAGSYNEAIPFFTKAIEINPNSAKAYYERGSAYYNKAKYDPAISDFDKAIEIDPKYADAYGNRALAYFYKRDYDMAWENVRKAKELGAKLDRQFLEYLKKASGRED